MPETFSCPNCGAPLEYKGGSDLTFPCPFCHTSVIVPENLRVSAPTSTKPPAAPAGMVSQADIFKRIENLLKSGRKIEAIKLYRQCYNVDLAKALKMVEAIEAGKIITLPDVSVDQAILEGYSEEPSSYHPAVPGWLIGILAFLIPTMLILAIIFGLNAIFAARQPRPAANLPEPRTGPTIAPFATTVRQVTPTGFFASEISRFGGEGIGPGQFHYANDIALAPDGKIYVGDRELAKIQVFSASGEFITQWILDPEDHYRCLAAGSDGRLYVNEGGRVYVYDPQTMQRIGEIKYTDKSGESSAFNDLAALPDGGLVASWINWDLPSDDLLFFDSGGNLLNHVERAVTGPADSGIEGGIQLAVDGLGNIYGLGTSAQTIVKYSPTGKFLTRFGTLGDDPGQFAFESSIAIDSQGLVYVFGNHNLIFDSLGLLLGSFDLQSPKYAPVFDRNDNLIYSTGTEIVKTN